jgi:hypothetical protein
MKKTGLFTASEAAVASAPPENLSYEELKHGRPNGQSSAMRSTESAHNYQSRGSRGRPTGALVVAILYFLIGGSWIFMGVGALMGAMLVGAAMGSAASQGGTTVAPAGMAAVGGIVFLLSLFIFVIGIARIAIGVGILQMKEWARAAAISVEGLSSLRNMFGVFSGEWFFSFIGIGISVAISIYLLRDDVRRDFSS